jgi:hypothetical protein
MKRHAILLNPAFQTQLELRRVLGGPAFWKKETKRLTALCKEQQVDPWNHNTIYIHDMFCCIVRAVQILFEIIRYSTGGLLCSFSLPLFLLFLTPPSL